METRIILAYLIICFYYTLCRIHYLFKVKADEEFNTMLDELKSLTNDKSLVPLLILLYLVGAPLLAPFSMIKQFFKLILKKRRKKG